MLFLCLSVCHQYSEKEDKYEEEIKVLTDKLKEVRWCFHRIKNKIIIVRIIQSFRDICSIFPPITKMLNVTFP